MKGADDNFLPLRHLAAWLVLYGHAYALAYNPSHATDLVAKALPGYYAGSLAVHLFFAISGYLVTLGLLRNPGVLRYAKHRVLRVYPGHLACLLLVVFVLGPMLTTLDAATYFAAPQTWKHVRGNLLPISFEWTLPGVFASNPMPHVVNGTLWSLGLEVRWYFYLGVLAALTVVRRRWLFTAVAGAFLAFSGWEWWIGKPDELGYRALSQVFLLGALAAHWRAWLHLGPETGRMSSWTAHAIMAAMALCAILAAGTRWAAPVVVVAALAFVLWFAYRAPKIAWPKRLDLSYGLFLYGYPVQQMGMATMPTLSPLALCALATPIAALLAFASWKFIEEPALGWRKDAARAEPAP